MREYFSILLVFSLFFTSCEHTMTLKKGKIEIAEHLNASYKGQFAIDSIAQHFSQDLFKQQVGFKVWLKDSSSKRFGPVFFQKNKYQGGWITYGGTDVITEYEKVKK